MSRVTVVEAVPRLAAKYRRNELRAEAYRNVTQAVSEAVETTPVLIVAALPGDTRKLRGIPCIARGVGGTSPGTSPEREAIRRCA